MAGLCTGICVGHECTMNTLEFSYTSLNSDVSIALASNPPDHFCFVGAVHINSLKERATGYRKV